jgi:hypothetical protein
MYLIVSTVFSKHSLLCRRPQVGLEGATFKSKQSKSELQTKLMKVALFSEG